ncbi:MAG: tetratricopeptide repeat protein [Candidatus Omnitrophica bacterium]|nr:tetratricopeptide repeat protein [Candidatus Omnitrophota bacterium]
MNIQKILLLLLLLASVPRVSVAGDLSAGKPAPLKKIEISEKIIEKELPFYRFSLKELIEEVDKNIKKAELGIKGKKVRVRNQGREKLIREHFAKGLSLYKEGKLDEARKELLTALEISQHPDMEDYIKESVKWPK